MKGHLLFIFQNDPGCLRTGKRKGVFPQPLKFLDMSGILAAGIAKHGLAGLNINIAEPFFIEKSAASVILPEYLFFPVFVIVKTISERPLYAQQVSGQAPAMQENFL